MGAGVSREDEISSRLLECLEYDHTSTLHVLLKCIQHVEGGSSPLLRTKAANIAATEAAQPLRPNYRPPRPPPPTLTSLEHIDAKTAEFHARAAAVARKQAVEAGLSSASFPIPLDLNTLRMRVSGDPLCISAVKKNQPQVLSLLCEAGVDTDTCDSTYGWSALHHAARLQRLGCMTALLNAQALSIVHATNGLLPSQVTPSAEIQRRLQVREREDEIRVLESLIGAQKKAMKTQGLACDDDSIIAAIFDTSTSANFPLSLYRVEAPKVVRCTSAAAGLVCEVFFRGPGVRSTADCIQLYYCDDAEHNPHWIRPRVGSVFYLSERRENGNALPPSLRDQPSPTEERLQLPTSPLLRHGWDSYTIHMRAGSLPMGNYRIMLYDSARNVLVAASDIIEVTMDPNASNSRPPSPQRRDSNPPAPMPGSQPRRLLTAAEGANVPAAAAAPTPSNSSASGGLFSYLPSIITAPFAILSGSSGNSATANGAYAAGSSVPVNTARRQSRSSSVNAASPSRSAATTAPVSQERPATVTASNVSSSSYTSAAATATSSVAAQPQQDSSLALSLHPQHSRLSSSDAANVALFSKPAPAYWRAIFTLNRALVDYALRCDARLANFRDAMMRNNNINESEFWQRYFFRMSQLEDAEPEAHEQQQEQTQPQQQQQSHPQPTEAPAAGANDASSQDVSVHPQSPVQQHAPSAATVNTAAASSPAARSSPVASAVTPARSAQAAATVSSSSPRVPPSSSPRQSPAKAAKRFADEDSEDDSSGYVPPSFDKLPANPGASPNVQNNDTSTA